jgi:phosphoglycerate dehydrogenase-like enzyme
MVARRLINRGQMADIVLFYDGAARLLPTARPLLGPTWRVESWYIGDDAARLTELLREAVAIVAGKSLQSSTLRGASTNLRLLQMSTAGYEWIDFADVPAGAHICNTSTMDHAIAEFVLASLLEWQIGLRSVCERMKAEPGSWVPPFGAPGRPILMPFHSELGGKTLGIIGYGHIGCQVAKRAAAFNMRIVATTARPRSPCPPELAWCEPASDAALARLLSEADFVVLACAVTSQTEGIINAERLALMKRDAVLINIGRGPLCDEQALFDALKTKSIRGASLDVWWRYPSAETPSTSPSHFPFHELDNVAMTPHFSGWTREQEERKAAQIASNLELVARRVMPKFVVRAGSECS